MNGTMMNWVGNADFKNGAMMLVIGRDDRGNHSIEFTCDDYSEKSFRVTRTINFQGRKENKVKAEFIPKSKSLKVGNFLIAEKWVLDKLPGMGRRATLHYDMKDRSNLTDVEYLEFMSRMTLRQALDDEKMIVEAHIGFNERVNLKGVYA